MRAVRAAAATTVGLAGFLLLVPNLTPLLGGEWGVVARLLSAVGAGVSVALVVVGAALYRSTFSAVDVARVAVWTLLGLVVLGAVALGLSTALGPSLARPVAVFATANLLAIAAGAHVIIGVVDVRRVRAEQLARERRKLAVLARVLRHNLRNDANVIAGNGERLRDAVDGDLRSAVETVVERASHLGTLSEEVAPFLRAYEDASGVASLREAFEEATATAETAHPDATLSTEVSPSDLRAAVDPSLLAEAVSQLVENAAEHAGESPSVRLSARRANGRVIVEVADDGPGVPEVERAVVSGDTEITQLTHGSGLGLWVVTAVAEAAGGDCTFHESDAGGALVRLSLPPA
jgi:signal transduction histidine kinase